MKVGLQVTWFVVVAVVAFLSALGGALLALRLDNPDIVVTETVVEVPATVPPAELSASAVDDLSRRYVELTGLEDDWTAGLVHEIGYSACNGLDRDEQYAWYVSEMERAGTVQEGLDEIAFRAFFEEVQAACDG